MARLTPERLADITGWLTPDQKEYIKRLEYPLEKYTLKIRDLNGEKRVTLSAGKEVTHIFENEHHLLVSTPTQNLLFSKWYGLEFLAMNYSNLTHLFSKLDLPLNKTDYLTVSELLLFEALAGIKGDFEHEVRPFDYDLELEYETAFNRLVALDLSLDNSWLDAQRILLDLSFVYSDPDPSDWLVPKESTLVTLVWLEAFSQLYLRALDAGQVLKST